MEQTMVKIILRHAHSMGVGNGRDRVLMRAFKEEKSNVPRNLLRIEKMLLHLQERQYCCTCKKVKAHTEFGKQSKSKHGIRTKCNQCRQEYRDSGEAAKGKREARKRNPEKYREAARRWKAANPEKVKEMKRNSDRVCRERVNESSRKWRKENPEKRKEIQRKYRANNLDKLNAAWHKRRAAKMSNGGSHTVQQWNDRLEYFGHKCVYCGCGGKMTKDHKKPIALGGQDFASNLVPACQTCNSKKGDAAYSDFMPNANRGVK